MKEYVLKLGYFSFEIMTQKLAKINNKLTPRTQMGATVSCQTYPEWVYSYVFV